MSAPTADLDPPAPDPTPGGDTPTPGPTPGNERHVRTVGPDERAVGSEGDEPARADAGQAAVPVAPVQSWPGPVGPPSRRVLGAVVLAAVVTATAVPEGRPGIGWLVTAVVLGALAFAVRWQVRPVLPSFPGAGWGALAIGLAAVSALRDAGWLVALCLLAAVAAGSLAVAGRSFRSVVMGALAVWAAAARGVPWIVRGIPRGTANVRIALSGLAALALVAVFLPLLVDADAAFASAVGALVPAVDADSAFRLLVLAGLGAAGLVGASFLLAAPPEPVPPAVRTSRLRPLEWALPLVVLAALFAAFLAVQVVALLGGDAYVRASTGLTYAEYARSGFWQLLAVTVLALGVIRLGQHLAPGGRRAPLAVLAVLTLGVVATALGRMWLYQQAYGFTVLRLLVLTCEVWLGIGFVLVLVAVLRGRTAGGLVVTGAVLLLGLALADPERIVAEQNVARYAESGRIDIEYLSTLSADAAPALDRLPEPARSCALERLPEVQTADEWRGLNAARAAVADVPVGPCRRDRSLS